jgi:glutamyl-tRNA reductase
MKKFRLLSASVLGVVLVSGVNAAQYPIMEKVASKIVQKYQQSSCEQLWQEKMQKQGQSMPEMEQRAVQALRNDPQMREAFINRVAAPIANKMFECGMIP